MSVTTNVRWGDHARIRLVELAAARQGVGFSGFIRDAAIRAAERYLGMRETMQLATLQKRHAKAEKLHSEAQERHARVGAEIDDAVAHLDAIRDRLARAVEAADDEGASVIRAEREGLEARVRHLRDDRELLVGVITSREHGAALAQRDLDLARRDAIAEQATDLGERIRGSVRELDEAVGMLQLLDRESGSVMWSLRRASEATGEPFVGGFDTWQTADLHRVRALFGRTEWARLVKESR